MKKLLLCSLLALLLLPQVGHAQRRRRSSPVTMGLTYGGKVGLSYATLSGAGTKEKSHFGNIFTYSGRAGLLIGGLLNYRFSPEGSFQIEALFTQRGTSRAGSGGLVAYSDEIKTDYLDVPILAKYNFQSFYFEVGLVPSLLLSVNAVTNGTKVTGIGLKDEINSYDVGGAIGAGIEASKGFVLGLRYVRGFMAIGTKESPSLQLTGKGLNNSSVQLWGGYILNHSLRRGGRRRH